MSINVAIQMTVQDRVDWLEKKQQQQGQHQQERRGDNQDGPLNAFERGQLDAFKEVLEMFNGKVAYYVNTAPPNPPSANRK